MIEILDGIFYDPTKEWYEQPFELIQLATEVEQTAPIDYDIETFEQNSRVLWSEWESTTECGTFIMRVEMVYLYGIENGAFKTKSEQNKVKITKI
jgi:hypothetical protein